MASTGYVSQAHAQPKLRNLGGEFCRFMLMLTWKSGLNQNLDLRSCLILMFRGLKQGGGIRNVLNSVFRVFVKFTYLQERF